MTTQPRIARPKRSEGNAKIKKLLKDKARREEIENPQIRSACREKILKYSDKPLKEILEIHENAPYFGIDLPF